MYTIGRKSIRIYTLYNARVNLVLSYRLIAQNILFMNLLDETGD